MPPRAAWGSRAEPWSIIANLLVFNIKDITPRAEP